MSTPRPRLAKAFIWTCRIAVIVGFVWLVLKFRTTESDMVVGIVILGGVVLFLRSRWPEP